MKIAVMADMHGNYLVFKKSYDDAISRNVDLFFFLGDYLTDGFESNEIVDIIRNSNCHSIKGNREIVILENHLYNNKSWNRYDQLSNFKFASETISKDNISYLNSLDITKVVEVEGKRICLSHGSPYLVNEHVISDSYETFDRIIEDFDCDMYLFGHQHKFFHTEYKNRQFINPGSIGLPTDGLPFKYGIITIENDNVNYEKVEIDYEYEMLEKHYKNSSYYREGRVWCELILMIMKTGINHPILFQEFAYKKAFEEGIDVSVAFPNEFYNKAFEEYMTSLKK